VRPAPIKERILRAYRHGIEYHELARLVFPEADYPRAFNGATKGGPPGCYMALSKALRELGGGRDREGRTWLP
jgi:hypothetical protein